MLAARERVGAAQYVGVPVDEKDVDPMERDGAVGGDGQRDLIGRDRDGTRILRGRLDIGLHGQRIAWGGLLAACRKDEQQCGDKADQQLLHRPRSSCTVVGLGASEPVAGAVDGLLGNHEPELGMVPVEGPREQERDADAHGLAAVEFRAHHEHLVLAGDDPGCRLEGQPQAVATDAVAFWVDYHEVVGADLENTVVLGGHLELHGDETTCLVGSFGVAALELEALDLLQQAVLLDSLVVEGQDGLAVALARLSAGRFHHVVGHCHAKLAAAPAVGLGVVDQEGDGEGELLVDAHVVHEHHGRVASVDEPLVLAGALAQGQSGCSRPVGVHEHEVRTVDVERPLGAAVAAYDEDYHRLAFARADGPFGVHGHDALDLRWPTDGQLLVVDVELQVRVGIGRHDEHEHDKRYERVQSHGIHLLVVDVLGQPRSP